MEISVILVSYNTAEMSKQALQQLYESKGDFKMHVFVVDNASKDDSATKIKAEFPELMMIENTVNVGFGRANNQIIPLLKGDYVLLLNTDAFIQPDAIQKSLDYMKAHANVGVLGARLIGRDHVLQPSCRYFPTPVNIFMQKTGLNKIFTSVKMVDDMHWDHNSVRLCDWVPGCYYLIRKEVIERVGLFDPRFFLYYEEVDHCFATKRAGWEIAYFSDTTVVHIGGESAKQQGTIKKSSRQLESLQVESEMLYFRKNHGIGALLLNFALHMTSDIYQVLKDLLKLRLANLQASWSHMALNVQMLLKTRLGTQPTR